MARIGIGFGYGPELLRRRHHGVPAGIIYFPRIGLKEMNIFDEYRGAFQYQPHQANELPIVGHSACIEGNAALANGDVDLAITCFAEGIRLTPDCPHGHYNRGLAYVRKGRFGEALEDFTKAIQLNPQHVEAYVNRGTIYDATNQVDRAHADYTEALRLNPNLAAVYLARARINGSKGAFDGAIADCSAAIRLKPDFADAYLYRGLGHQHKGELDEAVADFTQAIRLGGQDAQVFHDRGLCYALKGDYKKAIADFSEAIRLDPKFAGAYHNRGMSYVGKGEHAKAERDFAKAKQCGFDPHSPGPRGGSQLPVEAVPVAMQDLAHVQTSYAKHQIRKLVDITITGDLGFVRDRRGAILQFMAEDSEVVDVFSIGMSKESLRKCRAALNSNGISWRMSDGSLIVTGGKDKVTLKFVSEMPGVKPKSIALTGAKLAAFTSALESLAK